MNLALEPGFLRRFIGFLATLLAVYVVFLALLILVQRYLMYFPDDSRFDPAAFGLAGFQRIDYATQDGTALHAFVAPPAPGNHLTIAFFQGNAGNLDIRVPKIKLWRDWGYGVLLVTYRGFDGNPGRPDEPGLYADGRAALEALKKYFNVSRENIVLYGESMGTGIATQMAIEGEEAGLILEVPYTSITDVGSERYPFVPIFWMVHDRFESFEKIRDIHSPLLVLRAGRDFVIPPILEQRLFDRAREPKTLITDPTAGHMDMYQRHETVDGIRQFLDGLSPVSN